MTVANLRFQDALTMSTFLTLLRSYDDASDPRFPKVMYSDLVLTLPDINDRSLEILRKALAVTEGWEVVGPCCPHCGRYTVSLASVWKCLTPGCDYTRNCLGSNTITSRSILGKVSPMPHVMPAPAVLNMAKEIRDAVKNRPYSAPISAAQTQAAVNRFSEKLKECQMAMMYGGQEVSKAAQEKAELLQQITELNKKLEEASKNKADLTELLKETDRLLRAVAGINYQDHTVAEQREIRDSVRAVMAAIAKVDLTKRAE